MKKLDVAFFGVINYYEASNLKQLIMSLQK